MAERYTRLFSLPENLYTPGAPVVIAAGALLKDNQTGNALAQIKFKSISKKQIKAVQISITAFDVSGKELEGIAEYQYLDLTAARTAEFGHKQAVTLPDAVTRSIEVKCTDVFFTDGSVWNAAPDAVWTSLPSQKTVTAQLGNLAAQYQRDTTPKSKFIPIEHEDLWFCSCGAINHCEESKCHNCQHNKDALFAALDIDALRRRDAEYNAAEVEKAEKQAAADAVQRAKTTKLAIITAVVIAVIASAFWVTSKIIIPNSKYNNAVALMDAGKYEDAIASFEALDGYKDSADKISACNTAIIDGKYNEALSLMNSGKYKEAVAAFQTIEAYENSADQILVCKYNIAIALMASGDYDAAIAEFEKLNGYEDSQEHIKESTYKKAVELTQEGKCFDAIKILSTIENYKDASKQIDTLWDKIAVRDVISAADAHSVGLKDDGSVISTEYRGDKEFYHGECAVSDWKGIIAVSAGAWHTAGLKADGTVVATKYVGETSYDLGQFSVSKWSDIVAISASTWHTVGLKNDGTVVAVGSNDDGECDVGGWSDIIAISTGDKHTIGLKNDGTVVAVGDDSLGQCNVSSWTDIIAITSGHSCTVGLKKDGTVVATGYNDLGCMNVSEWKDIVAISTGMRHTVGIKNDGTVIATGSNIFGECDLDEWTDIVAISAGERHTIGLKADGTLITTSIPSHRASYDYGQCDVTDWTNIRIPN